MKSGSRHVGFRAEEWLAPLYAACKAGRTDAAIDLIYDRIDQLCYLEEFGCVDEILFAASPDFLTSSARRSLLVITMAVREHLVFRGAFHAACFALAVEERGPEAAKRVFGGLA